MNVVLFGATGMIGQSALKAYLADERITSVRAIVRRATGVSHPKLRDIIHTDFTNYDAIGSAFDDVQLCGFFLGVSAAGMSEADYTRVTYDYALAAATALLGRNPNMAFQFVSGAGADSTERGRLMWARVKGRTENALLAMAFPTVQIFRPGFIQPLDGIVSSTPLYRALYRATSFLLPVLRAVVPKHITTTRILGRAFVRAAVERTGHAIFEMPEINTLGALSRA